ncbi:MAG: hypothetical protein FWD48_01015 [Oscillospiraceae bacterium]|nr:hypothetical protein [Oscillospiraceae bacterium]
MNDIEVIINELDESGIDIDDFQFEDIRAVSICQEDGARSIGLDKRQFETSAELKSVLLHEQGHCETHTFYNASTSPLMRGKLERRADRYVTENKITKYDIVKANKREGLTEIWEFAEHFGVTVEYMKRIMNIHFQMEFME